MFSYKFYPNPENFTPSWMVTFSKSGVQYLQYARSFIWCSALFRLSLLYFHISFVNGMSLSAISIATILSPSSLFMQSHI